MSARQQNNTFKYHWTLIFVGNPSRGDDAIGPLLFQSMEQWLDEQRDLQNAVHLIDSFQLEPELCYDIKTANALIIIDASAIRATGPWVEIIDSQTLPHFDQSHTWTHSMPPAALLTLFNNIYQVDPPTTYILHIPGKSFELGTTLSKDMKKYHLTCLELLQLCCQATSPEKLQGFMVQHARPEDIRIGIRNSNDA